MSSSSINRVTIATTKGEVLSAMSLGKSGLHGKRPFILVIHGWTSSMSRYPERLAPAIYKGYSCVMFDMRGHGETGYELSNYSRKDHFDDCLAAYDYMVKLPNIDLENISVFGSSYGGYMATLLSAERKVHNLILKAPAQYPDEGWDEPKLSQERDQVSLYRQQPHTIEDNKALKAINIYQGKLLFIECEKDEQVPKQVMVDYRKYISVPYDYELLEGSDHACKLPGTNEMFVERMGKWFTKQYEAK
ncbi:alpha/beta fold hydrolase [Candidatus Woesebacteria bacterium]|nr:alpha/beta fold hydrolase [Candidatus Woesebacteria bacterium]